MPKQSKEASVSQAILSVLLNNVPDLVFVKDHSGVYIECNEAFSAFVGVKRSEIIGRTDYDIFPKDVADFFRHHDMKMIHDGNPKRNEEWVTYPDGKEVLLDTLKIPYQFAPTQASGVLGISRDITLLKQAEEQASLNSQRYDAVLNSSKDGFLLINALGEIIEVNDAYCDYSGYCRDEILTMSIGDLDSCELSGESRYHIQKLTQNKNDIFESIHRRKDGSTWPVEVSISYSYLHDGCFFSLIRDITDRKNSEAITALRYKLLEMVFQEDLQLILREALDAAENLTASKIGFFHFVEDDEDTISLQTWSTRTLKEMCYATGVDSHYPVSEAGVWVDCIHEGKPVIHNDYPGLKHKKGMPDGHPHLERELTVPLFREGKVVSIIGVGNKDTEYTDKDISIVQQISELCFQFAERKRAEQQIQFMAYNDVLTKLPNRQLFSDRLHQAMSQCLRTKETVAICYLDLDEFKPINDRYGHDAGDELLIELARRLKGELREEDTLSRLGGMNLR